MSFKRYIELLQQLITMTDPKNRAAVICSKNILQNLIDLIDISDMGGTGVLQAMRVGYNEFEYLLQHRKEFAGKPGDINGNRLKRQRLAMMVEPRC